MSGIYTPSFEETLAVSRAHGKDSCAPHLWDDLAFMVTGTQGGGKQWYDVSAHDNHGDLTNMDPATDWVPGDPRTGGYALEFDGTEHTVVIGTDYGRPTAQLSVVVWAKVDVMAGSGDHDILLGDANLGTLGDGWAIQLYNANTVRFWVEHWDNDVSGAQGEIAFSDTTKWHSFVGVYDGVDVRVYVDGVLGGTVGARTEPIEYTTATGLQFGQGFTAGNDWFTGRIGAGAVYARALAFSEIQQLHVDPLAMLRRRTRTVVSVPGAPPAGTILPQVTSAYYGVNA